MTEEDQLIIKHRRMVITRTRGSGKLGFFDRMAFVKVCNRDNVYSIYAVYGLALAYRRVDNDNGRACKSGEKGNLR